MGAWVRVENTACARRLSAIAEYSRPGHPRTGQPIAISGVWTTGTPSRVRWPPSTGVTRRGVAVTDWGVLSKDKIETAVDDCVERYGPWAVRRTELSARNRHITKHANSDGSGTATLEAVLFAHDAQAVDARLDAMAATVCNNDPRTHEQRRADALGALGHGVDRLACLCGAETCPAATPTRQRRRTAFLSDPSRRRRAPRQPPSTRTSTGRAAQPIPPDEWMHQPRAPRCTTVPLWRPAPTRHSRTHPSARRHRLRA